MAERNNDDYVVNQPQMDKFVKAYEFFCGIAAECGGVVEPPKIEPKRINGGITAYFTVFYANGEKLQELSEIVGDMSAISIDSMSNGDVCISFNIPEVFRKSSS